MLDQAKIKEAQTDWDNLGTHEARLAAYAIIELYTLNEPNSKKRLEARAKIDQMTDPYAMKRYMQNAIALGARILAAIAARERREAAAAREVEVFSLDADKERYERAMKDVK